MLTTFEKVLFLQDLEFFAFAGTEHLAEFAARCRVLEVERGTLLFKEGEPARQLYLVIFGRVALEEEDRVGDRVEGDCLDSWSVLAERPYQYTACAETECTLFVISFEELVEYLTSEPDFCWAILKHMSRRHFERGRAKATAERGDEDGRPSA